MSKDAQVPQMIVKVVFVGDLGVGKTSLLSREAENTFTMEHLATIGVDFRMKTYQVGKLSVKAQLWDTAGQERFRSIQKPYYRGSNAILLCFNLADRTTFINLVKWLEQIKGYDVKGQIYLVGCKSDLEAQVPTDQILTFASAYQVNYFQTSAKENEGVNQGFRKVIQDAAQAKLIEMAYEKKPQAVVNIEPEASFSRKKGCC